MPSLGSAINLYFPPFSIPDTVVVGTIGISVVICFVAVVKYAVLCWFIDFMNELLTKTVSLIVYDVSNFIELLMWSLEASLLSFTL